LGLSTNPLPLNITEDNFFSRTLLSVETASVNQQQAQQPRGDEFPQEPSGIEMDVFGVESLL